MLFSSIDSTQEELGIPTTATKGSETDWKAKCEELEESHKRAIEEVKLKTKSAVTERSKLVAELTDVSQRAQPKELEHGTLCTPVLPSVWPVWG